LYKLNLLLIITAKNS